VDSVSDPQGRLLRQLDGTVQHMHLWMQNVERGLRADLAALTARVESLEVVARETAFQGRELAGQGQLLRADLQALGERVETMARGSQEPRAAAADVQGDAGNPAQEGHHQARENRAQHEEMDQNAGARDDHVQEDQWWTRADREMGWRQWR